MYKVMFLVIVILSYFCCSVSAQSMYICKGKTAISFHVDSVDSVVFSLSDNESFQKVLVLGSSSVQGPYTLPSELKRIDQINAWNQVKKRIVEMGYSLPDNTMMKNGRFTICSFLRSFLGANYTITVGGIGGESINTIMARSGAISCVIPFGFLLPADCSPVMIADGNNSSFLKSSLDSTNVIPLLQDGSGYNCGNNDGVNPCYLNTIPCTLTRKYSTNPLKASDNRWYLQRNCKGIFDLYFPPKTSLELNGSKSYKNMDIVILWMGANIDEKNNDSIAEKTKLVIESLGSDKYIVITNFRDPNLERLKKWECQADELFGVRHLNLRTFFLDEAWKKWNIEPTSDDKIQIENGQLLDATSSLKGDGAHLSIPGDAMVAFKIYEMVKEFNW